MDNELMTEKCLQDGVIELARTLGWRVAHFRPAPTGRMDAKGKAVWLTHVQADGAGFPDLVLVRGKRLIFAELKTSKGNMSDTQKVWLECLQATPIEAYLWRPSHYNSREIEKLLR